MLDEDLGLPRVGKNGIFGPDQSHSILVGQLDLVGEASVTSMRDSLPRTMYQGFAISRDSAEHFDAEFADHNGTVFAFEKGQLVASTEIWLDGPAEDPEALEKLLTRFLAERRAKLTLRRGTAITSAAAEQIKAITASLN